MIMNYDISYIMCKYKINKLTQKELAYIDECKLERNKKVHDMKKIAISIFLMNFAMINIEENYILGFIYITTVVILSIYICKLFFNLVILKKNMVKTLKLMVAKEK